MVFKVKRSSAKDFDEKAESRLIIEPFDPEVSKPGGIDTCIRGIVKFSPAETRISIIGVDATGRKALRKWQVVELEGREINFFPAVRLNNADLRRRVPHSLRVSLGALLYPSAEKYDVVQSHKVNTALFCLLRYPFCSKVLFLHNSGNENGSKAATSFYRFAPWLYKLFERGVIPRMESVVIFSREGAERLARKYPHVVYSSTWFDPDRFYPVEGTSSGTGDRLKILWACRIEPPKAPLHAVDCFAELPSDASLTIAGDGTMRRAMEKRVAELGLGERVTFLGAVDKQEIGEVMRKHDMLLMSSEFEGYSRSIVEALACGLPVLTNYGGDPNHLIADGVNGARFTSSADVARAFEIARFVSSSSCAKSVDTHEGRRVVERLIGMP